MRIGQYVKVIASKPARGQDEIRHLVGTVQEIAHVWRETGEISIRADGVFILNKDEYVPIFSTEIIHKEKP